jgi:hypothetical protein
MLLRDGRDDATHEKKKLTIKSGFGVHIRAWLHTDAFGTGHHSPQGGRFCLRGKVAQVLNRNPFLSFFSQSVCG